MALVKQIWVLWSVGGLWVLSVVVLWLGRGHFRAQWSALGIGFLLGGVAGWLRWRHLSRRIARRDRRYERNKIFVDYLHLGEVVVTTVAYAPYVVLPVLVGLVVLVWLMPLPLSWWIVLAGTAGMTGASVVLGTILWYERQHGPLYYQYNSENWSGAEGLLYQPGTVVESLQPAGKVKLLGGVLWNAVSLSGEPITPGEAVEVIAVQGLTLYVDRLPEDEGYRREND
jgi:membrane protein implicated in regulation of membrane protease activity